MAHQMPLKFINLLAPSLSTPERLVVAGAGVGFAIWTLRRSLPERLVGVVCGSLCCSLYAVRADLAILAPSALAWAFGGWSIAAWLRRLAALALIGGTVSSALGVALFMLATLAAGLIPSQSRPAPQASPASPV